jgi:hypothetical protein
MPHKVLGRGAIKEIHAFVSFLVPGASSRPAAAARAGSAIALTQCYLPVRCQTHLKSVKSTTDFGEQDFFLCAFRSSSPPTQAY